MDKRTSASLSKTLIAAAVLAFFIAGPLSAQIYGKQWVQGADLPRTYGIGLDLFTMDHGYLVKDLDLAVVGIPSQVSGLDVDNSITELNLKLDAWVLPFLNVFGIVGDLDGRTSIDLRDASVPLPFNNLQVEYTGLVYGGGLTLAAGGRNYFGSLTFTYAESDLDGDFDSSVETLVWMPKVGLAGSKGAFWVGAMLLDATESHVGSVVVPLLGQVGFAIDLEEEEELSYMVGASVNWGEKFTLTIEGGFGDRTTMLISTGWRFGS